MPIGGIDPTIASDFAYQVRELEKDHHTHKAKEIEESAEPPKRILAQDEVLLSHQAGHISQLEDVKSESDSKQSTDQNSSDSKDMRNHSSTDITYNLGHQVDLLG